MGPDDLALRPVTQVTLLLNATFEPLCVVSARRAVVLVLAAKAVTVEATGDAMHSARAAVAIPAVVRLTRYVRVPYPATTPLSRRGVFARDGGRCAYCSLPATSLDHVVPRSRGGLHTWDNVVAACRRCNHIKADRTLNELGWRLHSTPRTPAGTTWRVLGHRDPDPRWNAWLGLAEPVSA